MTLIQLRHLLALAESGSFTRAAEALHLTQPALSRSVQALEEELGGALIDRIGRRLEWTPLGQEVLQRARHLVVDADELRACGQRREDGDGGQLRVGMGSGPAALLREALLLTCARERPKLRVEVVLSHTAALLQALRSRALDALVVDVRSIGPEPDLTLERVCELPGAWLVRPGHPLLRLRRRARIEDVLAYPIASTPLSDEVARLLAQRYGAAAHPAHCVTLRSEDVGVLQAVACASDAVLIAARAAAPRLKPLVLDPPLAATARYGLITLARRSEAPALGLLRALMDRHLVGH